MRTRAEPDRAAPADPGAVVAGVRGVTVRRGGRAILDGVDLDVRAGAVLAIVGPNGAGKSTLLGVLAGDVAPDAGAVLLDGRPVDRWSAAALARRRAVLPQQHHLAFPFTVTEVVAMGRAAWAGTDAAAEDAAVVADALEQTAVADLAGRQVPSLSGGEQARTALARVLAQRAPLLLLDEPTAALDLHHQELVLGVARARAEAGDAVVVVLHDLGAAAAHADEVAVVADGRLHARGRPAAVLTPALLTTVYHHDVEVLPHPRTGVPLVLPVRPPVLPRS